MANQDTEVRRVRVILANGEGSGGMHAAAAAMEKRRNGLDAVESGIREVEDDVSVHSVGTGGLPNMLGRVELDAAIMDGSTLLAGAVGALEGYRHPITVARRVMERLPHVLLVGAGAARFAAECGAEKADNLTEAARRRWREWIAGFAPRLRPDDSLLEFRERIDASRGESNRGNPGGGDADREAEEGHDTVIYVAVDAEGRISAGTSTSGLAWKYPGRLGDSPLVGSGLYADDRYGAAACIGTGEMAIRGAAARSMVLYMKMGMSVGEACREAARDAQTLRDRRGEVVKGALTLFAVDPAGRYHVAAVGERPISGYCVWTEGGGPESKEAERF